MRLITVAIMIAVSVSLAGCLSSNPSESDAKKVLLAVYENDIKTGDFTIDVKKTNGMEMNAMGVKAYKMNVDVTIHFVKGHNCPEFAMFGNICAGHAGEFVAPGISSTSSHEMFFLKSEKGWKLAPFGFR